MSIKLKLCFFVCAISLLNAYSAKFYNINSMYGISLREVNSVCSDDYGFIWASSKSGVLRLTEDDSKIYHLSYENANVIDVKLINQFNQLIAYTNNGQIFLFNNKYDRFDLLINLSAELKTKYLSIHDFLIDDSGTYWIATTHGFYKYQAKQLTLFQESNRIKYSISWSDKQHFILVRNNGIWVLDKQSKNSKCVYKYPESTTILPSVLYYDPESQKLWIGTASMGLFTYDFEKNTLTQILAATLPKQPILAIEKNSESTLLIGFDGQGVWEIEKSGDKVINIYKDQIDNPSSLRGNGVYDIYSDAKKRVWVCTFSGGLSFFDQSTPIVTQISHHINNTNSLINNDVNGIIEDHYGKIWFATNNGISCWDNKTNVWKHFLNEEQKQANVFLALCEDNKGRIWAGSYSSGVYVLDGISGNVLAHYANTEKGSPVLCDFILHVFKDSQGDIWIGGINGEYICYLSNEGRFRSYTTEPVSVFSELSPGKMLVGLSYGLLLVDKQTGELQRLILDIAVRDLLVVNNDIWICTGGDGLIRYNYQYKSVQKYTTQSGLPSNFVNSIIALDDYLYLGTENGMSRFDFRDNNFISYSSVYPLSRTSFNRKAYYKLKNGQLAWGTNNGAVIFEPKSLMEMPSKGTIYFQELSISGRSVRSHPDFTLETPVDSLSSISLKHDQNTLSLNLLPLKTSSGAKFSWKLEGFDKDWSLPSDNRTVTYTNIPNGDFKLKVRLYDSSLSNIINERSLEISIIPPFWKSLWFWGLVYLVLFGFGLLVLQFHLKSLKQKHTEEKVRFFTNTAHDIRTSLTLIKAPVEELNKEANLSENGRYFLNLAIEQSRRLSSVVTQLMDFQKADIRKELLCLKNVDLVELIKLRISMFEALARSKNLDLVFNSNIEHYPTAIDESKMEKVIDNLVSNAIKYSLQQSKVLINLRATPKEWSMQVIDYGIGIEKNSQKRLFKEFYRGENAINSKVVGSGIGLMLVSNYVKMHDGKIMCASQENVGSTFQIDIPFKPATEEQTQLENRNNTIPTTVPTINTVSQISSGALEQEPTMKVLIVEDNDDLLTFMQRSLSSDFMVYTAEDGQQALDVIEIQMPDLVVSDIMMPGMDGFELCKKLKSNYNTSHIPVILLTALTEKSEQLKGLGLGADDYLTKPFDMNLLIQKIKSIVQNRNIVRDKALRLTKFDSAAPIVDNELNDRFMKKLMEVAKQNISNTDFNKEDFASAMNVSASLLYKKVKALTNLSPTDFIKLIRLDYALELLQSRKKTVTEVSELCGFTSVGYFSTVFRKHFGKSPTEIL